MLRPPAEGKRNCIVVTALTGPRSPCAAKLSFRRLGHNGRAGHSITPDNVFFGKNSIFLFVFNALSLIFCQIASRDAILPSPASDADRQSLFADFLKFILIRQDVGAVFQQNCVT
jgi:hypothetical protein